MIIHIDENPNAQAEIFKQAEKILNNKWYRNQEKELIFMVKTNPKMEKFLNKILKPRGFWAYVFFNQKTAEQRLSPAYDCKLDNFLNKFDGLKDFAENYNSKFRD